jgi:hypothetical protein
LDFWQKGIGFYLSELKIRISEFYRMKPTNFSRTLNGFIFAKKTNILPIFRIKKLLELHFHLIIGVKKQSQLDIRTLVNEKTKIPTNPTVRSTFI